jgi:hypothetical protein
MTYVKSYKEIDFRLLQYRCNSLPEIAVTLQTWVILRVLAAKERIVAFAIPVEERTEALGARPSFRGPRG